MEQSRASPLVALSPDSFPLSARGNYEKEPGYEATPLAPVVYMLCTQYDICTFKCSYANCFTLSDSWPISFNKRAMAEFHSSFLSLSIRLHAQRVRTAQFTVTAVAVKNTLELGA